MKTVFLFIFIFISHSAYSIVIRHDVPDQRYHAEVADFPALATFYIDGAHGTLITPQWIVTAAHATFCVAPGSYVKINHQLHLVDQLYVHKAYQPGKSHDIALVKLKESINGIAPARLNKASDEKGQKVWFIGIGGTGNGVEGQTVDNYANQGLLRKAQNQIVSTEGPLISFVFDSGEKALSLEGVSGGGDSGGPAYQKNDGVFTLYGISSRFEGGALGTYGIKEVYSRISYFRPWIDKVITQDDYTIKEHTLPRLIRLPAGLSEEILPAVCANIGLKPALD